MTATFRINSNELSSDLITSIKEAFKGKTIEITVTEVTDETAYLLSSERNKEQISQSVEELTKGNSVVFTVEELQEKYSK